MYKVFNMGYLSKEVLDGFDRYKYSSVDTSFVSNYITHPFWNWVVQFYPKWLAPNVLTLVGFFHLLLNFAVLTYYDPKFLASSPDHSEYPPIPDWVWLFCGFNVFMSHTLDGTDGKQARRTGSSSPLGELFDHGLDSWATLFFPTAVYSVFGGGEYGVSPFRVSFVVMGIMFCFILSHWEKYNTGVLFLPWGYDISQIGMVFLFLLTYIGGQSMWHISLSIPGLSGPCSVADIVFILMHIGIYGLTLPPTLWNIYVGYRDKTGKMRGPWEAFRPLVSSFVLFGAMVIWGYKSPSNIIDVNPRLFYWTVGTVFSNIACRLIIAQMSDTRCELMNWMVYPLILIVALVINVPSLNELAIMWVYCMIITIAHIHFGVCVVLEMCEHFNISALTITKLKK